MSKSYGFNIHADSLEISADCGDCAPEAERLNLLAGLLTQPEFQQLRANDAATGFDVTTECAGKKLGRCSMTLTCVARLGEQQVATFRRSNEQR
jgi:hypothetical protein